MPDELNERAQDNWRPLIAIADAAGGEWPAWARSAAKALCVHDTDDESQGTMLLADIRVHFDEIKVDRVFSKALVEHLVELEERPWSEFRHGRAMTAAQLSRRLKSFGVTSKTIRQGATTAKGFEREQFTDVWDRYLPRTAKSGFESVTTVTIQFRRGFQAQREPTHE